MLWRFPSTVVSKFGGASTLIIGALLGNHLKNRLEPSYVTERGMKKIDPGVPQSRYEDVTVKEGSIIKQIHHSLQNISNVASTTEPITNFYIKRAQEMCQQYLQGSASSRGSAELWQQQFEENSEWIDTVDFWPRLPSISTGMSPAYVPTLLAGMKALWYLSCAETKELINCDIMKTLRQVVEGNDDAVIPLALKIIANILTSDENHHYIRDAGLVDTLKAFAESSDSEVFLPAWRALHNLTSSDDEMPGNKRVFFEGIYPFSPPDSKLKDPEVDIVLVHGVKGGAAWTWRQHDKEASKPRITQAQRRKILEGCFSTDVDELYTCCWPLDWLVPSLEVAARVIAVDYNARWWQWGNTCSEEALGKTIRHHSRDLGLLLRAAGVGDRPVIWCAHSMGGLIVKYLLVDNSPSSSEESAALCHEILPCMQQTSGAQVLESTGHQQKAKKFIKETKVDLSDVSKQTRGIVFFSVPHHGSPLASSVTSGMISRVLQPTTEIYEMRAESSVVSELHQSFLDVVKSLGVSVLTLNESQPVQHKVPGLNLHFVPSESGDPGVGMFYEVDASHLDICKPVNRDADSYRTTLFFLRDLLSRR